MNTKNWNKNEQGYKFTPPTSKLVHIQMDVNMTFYGIKIHINGIGPDNLV